jgi:hypothetical protein
MNRAIVILLLATAQASAANLVQNPGFEMRLGDKPAGWHVYVEPQEGSVGKLDGTEALDGLWSVMLHNEFPYSDEPANNWSQNVLEDLSNKTLTLRASIKTEEATEASLWIQCFRKDPWEIVLQKSTADTVPLRGSRPWTPVEIQVTVPVATDFVVVRCVLKGTGTAWFDQISLEEKKVAVPAVPTAEKPVTAPLAPESPVMPRVPDLPSAAPPSSDATRNEIVSAHEAIREANEALRQSNQALSEQLEIMREELDAMRKQIREVGDAAKKTPAESSTAPEAPVPPLVPRAPTAQDKGSP